MSAADGTSAAPVDGVAEITVTGPELPDGRPVELPPGATSSCPGAASPSCGKRPAHRPTRRWPC